MLRQRETEREREREREREYLELPQRVFRDVIPHVFCHCWTKLGLIVRFEILF